MVIDKLSRLNTYQLPHLEAALACLEQVKANAPGRYEFDGGFILIQEGTTSPLAAADFEAHRKYLDVQIVLDGEEQIALADPDDLAVTVPYSEAADRSSHFGSGCTIQVKKGTFYVCYPTDAHKCCGHVHTPTSYRKAVVKLSME